MAYAPVIDKDLDKYTSDSEIDAQWLRLDGANGPQNSIQWDLTPSATPSEGLMYWNEAEGGLNIGMPGGNVNLQIGQETLTKVKASEAILNGQVVYVGGADGTNPTVRLAKGDAEATSHGTIGVATEDINSGQSGYITTYGRVRELNTIAFTAGDDLYLSPTTAGALTNVRPDGDFVVHVGNCIRSHATQGEILVHVDVVHEAAEIRMKTVGSNTTYTTVQEMQDIFHSSGVGFGGAITDNGDGTYAVAAGGGYIRATNDATDTLLSFDWSANNSLTPSDGRNYVGVEYNGGNPQVVQRSSYNWNYQTDFPLGEVVKEGSVLHVFNAQHKVGDHAGKMIESMEDTMAFARDQRTGGLILGETGTRNVTLTAGNVWFGLTEFSIAAKDTSVADTFDTYYRDGAGGWTLGTGVTQWQNSQYDNGSGTLQSLIVNRYAVNWFYLDVEAGGKLVMVYPQAQYTTLASAEEDAPPASLPDRLVSHGKLIGRIVFQQGSASASSIETVFTTLFSSSQIVNHNNLAGLQGGTAGEYYHLTSAELTELQSVDSTYVPYTGASSDVDLGSFDLESTELRVKATSNHLINDSSDDFHLINQNSNKKVSLHATNGTYNSALDLQGSNGALVLTTTGEINNAEGVLRVTGQYNINGVAATLDFNPTITGTQAFLAAYFRPKMNGSNVMEGVRLAPDYTSRSSAITQTFLKHELTRPSGVSATTTSYQESSVSFNRIVANTSGNDAANITHNGFNIGGAITYLDITGTATGITDNLLTLNGGVSTYFNNGAGVVSQKGLRFQNFGTISGGTVKAMEANGGIFDHQYDYSANNRLRFGAGNDASIGYDGTDLVVDTALAGSGILKLSASTNWTANGTGTVTISNLAPAGVGTATISKWLTIKDDTGTVMYIPAWT